jgi:CHAT domain-containing protein
MDSEFPMNSALVLTAPQPPDPKDLAAIGDNRKDGLLQAWEIIQDLRVRSGCVVLSACETGVGKVLGGEGIMGLTRAFSHAGAESVVVSLWPISDESTALLMEAFYREVLAGAPRDVALMRAQIELAGSKRYSHPFFWAAFELHGRPE